MRAWSEESDDGSVHCLGNGLMCVFEQGPNVIQAFGPPYNTASVLTLQLEPGQKTRCTSARELGTALWTHTLERDNAPIGTLLDFVDADLPCLVREARLSAPLTLVLNADADVEAILRKDDSSLLLTAPSGRYLYPKYPMPYPVSYQLTVSGAATIRPLPEPSRWEIRLEAGTSRLHLVGGPSWPETEQHTEAALATPPETLLERTRAYWRAFTDRRRDFASLIPHDAPERVAVLRAVDDVAVIIKTQEARGGGVLAGYPYHLMYVRDQYGVSRCLLRLGYLEEAKGILQHYWTTWQRHGRIHNAQAPGVDGVFHVHENDEVEITGYLIVQAFDYAKASGDEAFLAEILPMLAWAWEAQQRHLAHGMLPFNGDETYVAGGILPRNTLNDGSAEATLLFITGGERLLSWIERKNLWPAVRLARGKAVLEETRAAYKDNFLIHGRYITNNPARKEGTALPRFRHGVCEACHAFGWTERNPNKRYVCPRCIGGPVLEAAAPTVYALQSVALAPFYLGASLPAREEITCIAEAVVERFLATGNLPSRPDGNAAVGYDPGLLLYTLSEIGHPAAGKVFDLMMSLVDATGAWVEYYENLKPHGTRYRPWESGINLEAALAHLARKYGIAL